MRYPEWLNKAFYDISDFWSALIPRKTPSIIQFKNAKVMAHRGIHDNKFIKENTMAAFEHALAARVWGIELDIRWTKDFQPVVHHDADTHRLFKKNILIKNVTLAELQCEVPEIPTLQEVVEQFGKKIKLVIELKEELYTNLDQRKNNFQAALKNLIPIEDFYVISLAPLLLAQMNCYSASCYFPVGRVNMQLISDLALEKNYAGVLGHYVFTRNKHVRAQLAAGQQVGTGFVESKNCLFRELNRGVTILSSNHPAEMQAIINQYLA